MTYVLFISLSNAYGGSPIGTAEMENRLKAWPILELWLTFLEASTRQSEIRTPLDDSSAPLSQHKDRENNYP